MPPRRPKDKGTDAERAVVRYLQAYGWPNAERRALRGTQDAGDITGTPGICWEVKSRKRPVSDLDVTTWLVETETETAAAGAEIGVLVVRRHGVGEGHAGRWWAYMRLGTAAILHVTLVNPTPETWNGPPVRMLLGDAVELLRAAGYGEPLELAR
jgi:hypothetical protein